MGSVSVAQAAERLGVSVPRIHQRIADGSLVAERIGSQWVIDERSLGRVQERRKAGRPLCRRPRETARRRPRSCPLAVMRTAH
ncbi:MAG: helix-turn-helix domain-containing protein [Actinobacteria bacterium]|nr:helix-turn-helix domain-containing protein [Actinomycetota bacterium]